MTETGTGTGQELAESVCHIETVLGSIIQPALEASKICGQVLEKGDMAVFMLNNVGALQMQVGVSYIGGVS